jgi:large subunit ribosomal protein L33
MSQDKLVKIKCQETGDVKYTRRNKKNSDKKLELKKYSSRLRKHTTWKELKK